MSDSRVHVDWSLIANKRILRRGSSDPRMVVQGEIPQFDVIVPMPPLQAGVVFPVELRMTCTADRQTRQFSRSLTLFSRDPFSTQQTFLQRAQIKLFDANGKTADRLDENEIPYTRLLDLAAVDLVDEGVLVVGEGVSFRKQRRLAESLIRAAHRGVAILCFAPLEGDFPLRIEDRAGPIRPIRLVLERENVVRRFDKRFDPITICSYLSLSIRRDEVVIRAAESEEDWSWLRLEFPAPEQDAPCGRLIVCGLRIVADWETSPVPRYLFAHLLQSLTDSASTAERQNHVSTQE